MFDVEFSEHGITVKEWSNILWHLNLPYVFKYQGMYLQEDNIMNPIMNGMHSPSCRVYYSMFPWFIFLTNENIFGLMPRTLILSAYRTEHNPIVLEINTNKYDRVKGNWKSNNSLLQDPKLKKNHRRWDTSIFALREYQIHTRNSGQYLFIISLCLYFI